MNSFKNLIKELDKLLKQHNLPNYKKLRVPLQSAKVDDYFKKLNISQEDLHLLYEWKDGWDINTPGFCSIMDFGSFISLESIITEIDYCSKNQFWPDTFIPIINDFSGSHILFNNEQNSNYGKLYLHSPSLMFVEPVTYYDSVYSMIETTIAAYNEGIFVYDEAEDWLNIDIPGFRRIGKRINKMSEYWNIEKHEW